MPINLDGFTSTVEYPASVFSLERHENFAYERFAYNTFREAIEGLGQRNIPPRLSLRFAPSGRVPAWGINASVTETTSPLKGFQVDIPELLPVMFVLFAKIVSPNLEEDERHDILDSVNEFVDVGSAMVREYKNEGLATAIRNAFITADLGFPDLGRIADRFDSLSYLVANHEIGHLYISQLTDAPENPADLPAFEHLADIVSSEWLFRHFIHNTPATQEYLEMRGVSNRSEALFENCKWCLETHFAMLILMGLAGAQQAGGRFHFEAGRIHPGAFSRFWLQSTWLLVGINAETANELGVEYHERIKHYFNHTFQRLCAAGLVTREALWQIVNEEQVRHIVRAAEIAESRKISDIRPGLDFLKSRLQSAAEMRENMAATES